MNKLYIYWCTITINGEVEDGILVKHKSKYHAKKLASDILQRKYGKGSITVEQSRRN